VHERTFKSQGSVSVNVTVYFPAIHVTTKPTRPQCVVINIFCEFININGSKELPKSHVMILYT